LELLVCVGILFLLLAFYFGVMRKTRHGESGSRIKCSSNLRQIGLAIKMYANGETRTLAFPRTRFVRETADRPTVFTGSVSKNPFSEDGPAPNDVTAALFLILRTQEITTDVFLCPMDQNADRFPIPSGKSIQDFSNFSAQTQLSYSIANPYPTEAAEKAGFTWDDNMPTDFAIMADKNPGAIELKSVTFSDEGSKQRKANSPNHQNDGQNVLYADGHVDWSASAWAGLGRDNIYGHNAQPKFPTTGPATRPALLSPPPVPIGIVGPPADGNDSVMLPTADQNAP
jgi:prepilin-type processing-associated H-X9-DG protein